MKSPYGDSEPVTGPGTPLLWGVQYIPVSAGTLHELLGTENHFDAALKNEMSRIVTDMQFNRDDEAANGHLGPKHHPLRSDLYEAQQRLRQERYFRSLGRPAGRYRRAQ